MSHDSHPESPDLEQRPALAGTAWVFEMLSEGTSLLSPEPAPGDTGEQPRPVMLTLIVIALLLVIAVVAAQV
jgi:hypothetical protein